MIKMTRYSTQIQRKELLSTVVISAGKNLDLNTYVI